MKASSNIFLFFAIVIVVAMLLWFALDAVPTTSVQVVSSAGKPHSVQEAKTDVDKVKPSRPSNQDEALQNNIAVESEQALRRDIDQSNALLKNYELFSPQELFEFSADSGFIPKLSVIASDNLQTNHTGQYSIEELTSHANALDEERSKQTTFSEDYTRIFMHFKHDEFVGQKVLVRWTQEISPKQGKLIQLNRHTIPSGQNKYFFWAEQNEGWAAGTYQVEVFAIDNSLAPLARGKFSVHSKE